MEVLVIMVLAVTGLTATAERLYCGRPTRAIERGIWTSKLVHIDSASIERPPKDKDEQIYVYEKHFPNHTIGYINVENLATRTCGAVASIKAGGLFTSGVMIVLHSEAGQEIRSVIDLWGTRLPFVAPRKPARRRQHVSPMEAQQMKKLNSIYLQKAAKRSKYAHNNSFFESSYNAKRKNSVSVFD